MRFRVLLLVVASGGARPPGGGSPGEPRRISKYDFVRILRPANGSIQTAKRSRQKSCKVFLFSHFIFSDREKTQVRLAGNFYTIVYDLIRIAKGGGWCEGSVGGAADGGCEEVERGEGARRGGGAWVCRLKHGQTLARVWKCVKGLGR